MIRSLDADVRSLLRSGIAVSNLTQCLDELVVNSLDAGATCVSVRVDIPSFRLQVIDNGCGISKNDLEFLGERYATSKCHSLEDLSELKSYGFRGEALASIRDIAGILEVVTRHKSSFKTYCKIFRNGKALKVTESCLPRSNIGTTISAYDLFSSLPVRRKLISDVFDLERMRQRLTSIALINPSVSFSLYNEASGQKCLQTHKSQSTVSTFSQLFGNLKAKSLREICFQERSFRISGYVGLETLHNKNLQFVYVNSRLLLKTKIHKLVNRLLARSLLLKRLALPCNDGDVRFGQQRSPPRQGSEKYPIFIMNISCPLTGYDITLEPAKTLVEFQDWDGILSCVQGCIESFLARENLVLPGEQTEDLVDNDNCSQAEDSSDSQVDLSVYEYQTTATDSIRQTQCISPSNIRKSLQSSVVHRKSTRLCSAENESGDTLHNQKGGREIKLTDTAEKRLKGLNNSFHNGKGLPNTRPENVVDIKIGHEKSVEEAKEGSSESGINSSTSTLGVENEWEIENPLGSRAQLFLRKSDTSKTRPYSKICFTSPNPITLQPRGARKRFHTDVNSKGKDTNSRTSLNRFVLDRSKKVSRISSIENTTVQGNITNRLNELPPNILTRDIANFYGRFSQDTRNDKVTNEQVSGLDGVESLREMFSSTPPKSNLQQHGVKEAPLDLIDLLDRDSYTERESSEANKTDDTWLFSENLIPQETYTKENETSAPDGKNKTVWTANIMKDTIQDEEESSCKVGVAPRGSGREAGTSEAPKDPNRNENEIRNEYENELYIQGEKISFGHENNEGSLENWQCTYDVSLKRKLYINLRTGNTSYDCPEGLNNSDEHKKKEDEERSLEGRMETRSRGPLSCAPHVSFDCTPWLPRKNRIRTTGSNQKECEINDSVPLSSLPDLDEKAMTEKPVGGSEGIVSLMFDEWDNPVFSSLPGMDITSLSKPTKGTGNEVRAHRSIHPYRFTKAMVKDLQVIRQVDDKFIVCRVRRPPQDESDKDADTENEEEGDCLIVLLDQHAVHERIRLEKLIDDLCVREPNQIDQPRLKASIVSPPVELEFTSQELLLLKRFRSELQRVGVRFVISSDMDSDESRVIVHELPTPFVDREVSETRRRRPSVAVSIVKELIQSHVEHMTQTSGVAPPIPKTILRVLSSQACHGAIKFGEHLTVEECKHLIQDLSVCDLPFQCAHGRPSIVPLVDLQLLRRKVLQFEVIHYRFVFDNVNRRDTWADTLNIKVLCWLSYTKLISVRNNV
uniref:DNA mismatch repair protein Mlh3 n=1 Tax=Actinia equina TaxID=6106 RepID=A0A6C0WZ19_ACTEQ|nr:DNA mismatch repair protein Mlh3 [Actinia equina]